MWRLLVPIALFPIALIASSGRAEVIFLGPIPYLSSADSPFDLGGVGNNSYFEDFEDGSFDLPAGVSRTAVQLRGPGPRADSVDADDGVVDGSGNGGFSLRPDFGFVTASNPPIWHQELVLGFNELELGYLPTFFGVVWTDGIQESVLRIDIDDADGGRFHRVFQPRMDGADNGETAEDRFVGVTSDVGIRAITVSSIFRSNVFIDYFEVDHIQFGPVPEPSWLWQLVIALVAFATFRSSRMGAFRMSRVRESNDEISEMGGGQVSWGVPMQVGFAA